jgi:hypothetical protein
MLSTTWLLKPAIANPAVQGTLFSQGPGFLMSDQSNVCGH